jgi:hypothetical protein
MRRAQEEFRRALDAAALPYRMGQLELFSDEEEQFIQNEVERKLYKPKLPNAGSRERLWLEKLKAFAKDESLVVIVKAAAGRYASALEALLPRRQFMRRGFKRPSAKAAHDAQAAAGGAAVPDEEEAAALSPEATAVKGSKWITLPGCYYTRKPVTPKTNAALYAAIKDLKENAGRDPDKRWLAQFLAEGEPEEVANFKMECLYLLRGTDGNVTRLVRLVNTVGEMSKGPETGETDILPAEQFASAEKFRAWCQLKGNFCWGVGGGAGNIELQMLHRDVANNAAYRVARLIEYCGWHGLSRTVNDKGQVVLDGLWFYDECAFTASGELLLPDDDGVITYNGEIFVLARKGREADFAHGRPKMRPNETLTGKEPWLKNMDDVHVIKLDRSAWTGPEGDAAPGEGAPGEGTRPTESVMGWYFREVCKRFYDTAGGMGGYMCVANMLGYAAGPEFFDRNGCLPSAFVPGQMGSGKTVFCNWLMGLQGYDQTTKGLGLGKGSRVTPVGLCQQLENYSSLAIWFDEYREYEISAEKVSIVRDAHDRQLAGKWTPDGVQRVIRTTPLVSGETDTRDSATRSRFSHQQISANQRLANHLDWMRDNRQNFYLFWREIMHRRPEFVELVMNMSDAFFTAKDTQNIPERSRRTHSLPYAAGEISPECFRVEWQEMEHPPGCPNQGRWRSYVLYIEPKRAMSELQVYLRKGNQSVTLTYNDLRDQLSKNPFWVRLPEGRKLNKRFGKRGQMATVTAWGIHVDLHPLGYRQVSDAEYQAALSSRQPVLGQLGPVFEDGDPRKGALFAIVDGWLKWDEKERREDDEGWTS